MQRSSANCCKTRPATASPSYLQPTLISSRPLYGQRPFRHAGEHGRHAAVRRLLRPQTGAAVQLSILRYPALDREPRNRRLYHEPA